MRFFERILYFQRNMIVRSERVMPSFSCKPSEGRLFLSICAKGTKPFCRISAIFAFSRAAANPMRLYRRAPRRKHGASLRLPRIPPPRFRRGAAKKSHRKDDGRRIYPVRPGGKRQRGIAEAAGKARHDDIKRSDRVDVEMTAKKGSWKEE